MKIVDHSSRELSMVHGDTCPHVKRVGVMVMIVDFFFFQKRAPSSSGGERLVGSSIAVPDTLLLRKGSKTCLRECDHT